MNKETLGRFIAENRKALGMTQEELEVSVTELIACEREVTETATVKKLLAEIFSREKVKKRFVAVMMIVVVAALCMGGYIGKEVELDNFDYVYEIYMGMICYGEAAIEIDGKYYRGCIIFTGVRDFEFYSSFYRKIYNI